MPYSVFDNKTASSRIKSMPNHQLANELHKLLPKLLENLKERKVYSSFKDYLRSWFSWYAIIGKFTKGIKFFLFFYFLLCATDIFSKYAWVYPLKHKKGVTIANAFQSILNSSMRFHSNKSQIKYG